MFSLVRFGAFAAKLFAASALPLSSVAPSEGAGRPIASAFFVSKSENKNEVHYAVRVGPSCAPLGTAPVYPYWRMLQRGPDEVEPLLALEQSAYGLATQSVENRGPDGGTVRVSLRALPNRPVFVRTIRDGNVCRAEPLMTIGGAPANLVSVFVNVGVFFRVESLTIRGVRASDRSVVTEIVRP